MAVVLNATSESHTGAVGSISEASFSWTMTPSGTARGLLVFVMGLVTSADDSTAVAWGGVSLTAVSGGLAQDTVGEPMSCKAWFLGDATAIAGRADDIIVVTRNNNINELWAASFSLSATAGMNTEVYSAGIVILNSDGTLAEQVVTDGSPGTDSQRFAGIASGLAASPGAGASSSLEQVFDTGNQTTSTVSEAAVGQGARNIGFSSGTSDDRAAVHLAVREVAAGGAADYPLFTTPDMSIYPGPSTV